MVIGFTFGQVIGALAWAYIAGFLTACAVMVVIESKGKNKND